MSSKASRSLLSDCVLFSGVFSALLDTADPSFVLTLFCTTDTVVLGLLMHTAIDVVTAAGLFNGTVVQPLDCPDTVVLSLASETLQ